MAINKNFVIKNGVEVNTSLIVGDATLNKVGVGTTVPGYTLHVGGSRGGIGATDLTVTGITTVGTSGSTSAALSVVGVSTFQGDIILLGSAGVSTISFDASLDKLNFADNARATFGTGNDLQIYHDGSNSYIQEAGTGSLIIYGTDETLAVFTDDGSVQLYNNDSKKLETTGLGITVYGDAIVSGVVTAARLKVTGISTFATNTVINSTSIKVGSAVSIHTDGNIAAAGIVTANGGLAVGAAVTLASNGNAGFAGIVTAKGAIDANGGINASSAKVEDLTDNRVVIVGTGGELEDDTNFTFDGAMLKVGTAVTVAVNGNAEFAGIVTVGGDLKVTGDLEISEDLILNTNLNLLGIASISTLDNSSAGIGSLSVTGVSTFSGDLIVGVSTLFADVSTGRIGIGTAVPASTLDVDGALTVNSAKVEDLTDNRVVIAGTDGELEDSGNLTFDGSTLTVSNVSIASTLQVAGVATFLSGTLVSGIGTFDSDIDAEGTVTVGTGITLQPHGGASFAGIVTVGGNLNVQGDITYDEIGGRNINITGFSTFGDDLNVGLTTFFVDVSNGGVGVGTDNPNPNGYGPQFKVFGSNPVLTLEDDGAGANAFGFIRQNSNTLQIVTGDNSDNKIQISKTSDTSSSWIGSNLTNIVTIDQHNIGVGIATATLRDSAKLDVDGDARFSGKVAVKDGGNAGAGVTIFDNGNIVASGIVTATSFVGSGANLTGLPAGTTINNNANNRLITGSGTANTLEGESTLTYDGSVLKVGTGASIHNAGDAAFVGVVTAGRGFNIGIQSAGIVIAQNVGISTLNFIGSGNSITYHSAFNQLDISIAGSGGGGGVSETDTSVSTTTATGVGSFAVATHRSAAIIAQIDQGANYQVGRYLMIHDGTTATVIEESAIATGDMLGSFSADINNSNAELKVTMNSSGIATVTTKIDTVTV